jgi:hypothetical protein
VDDEMVVCLDRSHAQRKDELDDMVKEDQTNILGFEMDFLTKQASTVDL